MDALSKLIQQLSMRSEVFYTGQLCGTSSFGDDEKNQGHLHIVRDGKLILRDHKGKEMKVDEPSIVYFPQTVPHVIEGLSDGAQLVCSTIEYSEGKWELLFSALPDKIVIPFRTLPALSPIMEGLFLEAESAELGQQVILDKLSDVMMIMLFRHIVDSNLVKQGVLAGLSHPRLSEVLNMIHQLPYKAFTMEDMAEKGAMSRTVFIDTFKKVVGMTLAITLHIGVLGLRNRSFYKESRCIGCWITWGMRVTPDSVRCFGKLQACLHANGWH